MDGDVYAVKLYTSAGSSVASWRVVASALDESLANALFVHWVHAYSKSDVRLYCGDEVVAASGFNHGSIA